MKAIARKIDLQNEKETSEPKHRNCQQIIVGHHVFVIQCCLTVRCSPGQIPEYQICRYLADLD